MSEDQQINQLTRSNKPCFIQLENHFFNKGDIVVYPDNTQGLVLKTYRNTWWRRVLRWFGFKVRINQIKVKRYDHRDEI